MKPQYQTAQSRMPDGVNPGGVIKLADFYSKTESQRQCAIPFGRSCGKHKSHNQINKKRIENVAQVGINEFRCNGCAGEQSQQNNDSHQKYGCYPISFNCHFIVPRHQLRLNYCQKVVYYLRYSRRNILRLIFILQRWTGGDVGSRLHPPV